MEEIWKDVLGYEKLYQVSNIGKMRSLTRMSRFLHVPNMKECFRKHKGKELKLSVDNNGYVIAKLGNRRKRLHRIIAELFVPNPKKLPCINHIDCNRSNNKISNLEWCTAKENMQHAKKLGRLNVKSRQGEKHFLHKLTERQVAYIKKRINNDYYHGLLRELSNRYNVSFTCISSIRLGTSWKHIK